MHRATWLAVPVLAALIALPASGSAQGSISVRFGTRLGPDIGIYGYSSDRYGDWQTRYRRWTPVTVYDINGYYYRNRVAGARAVQVYRYNNEYFFPPQDESWMRRDRRYNYQRLPGEVDYGRAREYMPNTPRVNRRLGMEVGVLGYSEDRAGDWRRNARRWTPVTLYESNGRYYQHRAAGARAVSMYRYQNEYFLPPTDQDWVGSDRRFNYRHQPTDDDRGRVRARP